jgi:hypothetical protein
MTASCLVPFSTIHRISIDVLLSIAEMICCSSSSESFLHFSFDNFHHIYIDIHGWAKSKVKNVDVVEIIKGKVKKG